ncbi:CoA transferase [Flavisphingomonas formosensis]|uniref:CoA transferase n=1 Tax=Flavisphingomonas formosensis TaxID=861534 RepID=UPI0018DF04C1|nr:CoA transferase [Sphingomonas formosensis]
MSMTGLFGDVRLIEIAGGLAPSIAGLLFAEMGAEVLRIEPRTGDPERGSAAFAGRNRSKHSVALDLHDAADRRSFECLLGDADLLIHDLLPSRRRELGLSDRTRWPRLIEAAIGGFPAGHPLEQIEPVDMLVLGAAGILDEQACVHRDGPAYLRFPLGSWGAAYLAATGAAARLLARDRGRGSGVIETSLLQGALTSLAMHWYRAEYPSDSLADGMPKRGDMPIFECANGTWVHVMANVDKVPLMQAEIERLDDALRQPLPPTTTYARLFPMMPANRAAFLRHDSAIWLRALWEADVPVQPAMPMGALFADEQARANGYVVEVDDPDLGVCLQPAVPITIEPPVSVRFPAPALGSHPPAWPDSTGPAIPDRPTTTPDSPLAGVRILDFGNFLAGPFAMMLAADLGADVVKVEATSGDQMRWIDWGFNGCQRGKRALALQLKDPRARAVLERLVAGADAVHHNLRMPAATKLGLDYASLAAIKPSLVYCHVNSYGSAGLRKDWPGYDQLFQAMSGWELEGAGRGNPPIWHRFGMMDHLAAMASLHGTIAALRERDRTGQGRFLSASLLGASLFTANETAVLADGSTAPFARLDAMQLGLGPRERLYRCVDGWIALLVRADDAWQRLTAAAGGDVEKALGDRTVVEALAFANEHGASAGPAREAQRFAFLDDAANRALGLVASYPHPRFGQLEQVGAFWRMDGVPARRDLAPPILGEHSRQILGEVGFDATEIDTLIADGVVVAT